MTAKHSGVAKLWLLNLVGNAALLNTVYYWLLLPDAHGWQVAGSAVARVGGGIFRLVAAHRDVRLLSGLQSFETMQPCGAPSAMLCVT